MSFSALPGVQRWLFGVIALGIPLSAIGALYPGNTWLQVGPVALALPLAAWALNRWPLSNASAACITAFILLHLFAARWSYSFVPYREWLVWSGGAATGRNMFDRLVHFAFGALAVLPVAEVGQRYHALGRRTALAVAVLFVLAVGGLYEIFEWSLTMTMAPADAGAYNGEQGDPFDSQNDMAMAAIGALIAIIPARTALANRQAR